MTTARIGDNVTLMSVEDWKDWNFQFKSKAVAASLWQKINPENPAIPFLKAPTRPDLTRYLKLAQLRNIRVHPSTETTLAITSDEEIDYGGHLASALEMVEDLLAAYRLDRDVYEDEANDVGALKHWVIATTSVHIFSAACRHDETIRQWYINLKQHVGTDELKEQLDAQTKYKTATRPFSKPPTDILAWLTGWENTIVVAIHKGVPEAQHSAHWFEDFKEVIRPYYGDWIVPYSIANEGEINAGSYSYITLANDFRMEIKSRPTGRRVRTIAREALGPTFAGQETSEMEGSKPTNEKKGTSKRRYTGGEQSGRSARGKPHAVARCYYVFPDTAPR